MSEQAGRGANVGAWVAAHRWHLAFTGLLAAVAILRLAALDAVPPGLYADEASIGYNAWSIAHYGVDEHGARLPLYFDAFGEYKNPVYIYVLVPFVRVLGLTPAVVRLPAALCGIGVVVLAGLTAWELTRDRRVTWLTIAVAAVTPWIALEGRVAFEQVTMVLLVAAVIWCYARATRAGAAPRWWWGIGILLAVAVYSYSSARLLVAALVVSMLVVEGRWRTRLGLHAVAPVAVSYLVLVLWAHDHPGALTARLDVVGINADGAGPLVLAGRFVRDYFDYVGFQFLFTNGDAFQRHSTGYGGMLLVVTAPLLLVGLWVCLRRRREPVPRLLLVVLVIGPVPAALTYEDTPHALRSSGMLPPLLVVIALGIAELLPLILSRRLLAGVVGAAFLIDAGGFMFDLYVDYPGRSLRAFDTGELQAISVAQAAADGHRVWLSERLHIPYIQALFLDTPAPVALAWPDNIDPALASIGMSQADDAEAIGALARPGDVMVLEPSESPPAGSTLLDVETVTVAPSGVVPDGYPVDHQDLVKVWRR